MGQVSSIHAYVYALGVEYRTSCLDPEALIFLRMHAARSPARSVGRFTAGFSPA